MSQWAKQPCDRSLDSLALILMDSFVLFCLAYRWSPWTVHGNDVPSLTMTKTNHQNQPRVCSKTTTQQNLRPRPLKFSKRTLSLTLSSVRQRCPTATTTELGSDRALRIAPYCSKFRLLPSTTRPASHATHYHQQVSLRLISANSELH